MVNLNGRCDEDESKQQYNRAAAAVALENGESAPQWDRGAPKTLGRGLGQACKAAYRESFTESSVQPNRAILLLARLAPRVTVCPTLARPSSPCVCCPSRTSTRSRSSTCLRGQRAWSGRREAGKGKVWAAGRWAHSQGNPWLRFPCACVCCVLCVVWRPCSPSPTSRPPDGATHCHTCWHPFRV